MISVEYIYIAVILSLSFIYYLLKNNNNNNIQTGKKVPIVDGDYYLVGHGLTFSKDVVKFIRDSYNKYGSIFQINIFGKRMTVVCDRELVDEFFNYKENEASLYDVLKSLFFDDAFFDNPNDANDSIALIKGSVGVKFDTFLPKIIDEATKMIDKVKDELTKNPTQDLIKLAIKFVARTSAKCFIELDMTDKFYDDLISFTNILNKIIVLTYFIPKRILRFFAVPILKYFKSNLINEMLPIIKNARIN